MSGLARRQVGVVGPALVESVAYVDPGNFATNLAAGSRFGYMLLWVIFVSNGMAMLIQYLSAKAGVATGSSLPTLCKTHFPRWISHPLWIQAELVAVATDLAEVLGGAIALHLIFGLPLYVGALVTAVGGYAALLLQLRGRGPFEAWVVAMIAVILGGLLVDLSLAGVDVPSAAAGLRPQFSGTESVLLAAGMLGATVMPHAIYLHGALVDRVPPLPAKNALAEGRAQRNAVVLAMAMAGSLNLALLMIAAGALSSEQSADTIEGAHQAVGNTLGSPAALFLALALLASGFAATSVGTLAGQVIMEGFLDRRVPLVTRRLVTLAPAVVIIGAGIDPTSALILSQVVLSFGIPFALVPLLVFTARRDLMGDLVNRRVTTLAAACVATVIITLNVVLIALTVW